MCEKCLEKYAALDPELVNAAETHLPAFKQAVDSFSKYMPEALIGLNAVSMEGHPVELDDLPEDEKANMLEEKARYERGMTAVFMAAFMSFRETSDITESILMIQSVATAMQAGGQYGQLCRTKARMGAH